MGNVLFNDDFSVDGITTWINRRLGAPNLEVELASENYQTAISDALKAYSRKIPRWNRATLAVSSTVKKYELPFVGRGVVELQAPRTSLIGARSGGLSIDLTGGIVVSALPYNYGNYGIDELYEFQIYQQMLEQMMGWDPQWEVPGDGYIYITNLPNYIQSVVLVYVEDHRLDTVPPVDQDWVQRFALALCRQMVGEVRSKYPIMGPAGQEMLRRGPEMLAQGIQEEADLRTELQARAPSFPPSWGDSPYGP